MNNRQRIMTFIKDLAEKNRSFVWGFEHAGVRMYTCERIDEWFEDENSVHISTGRDTHFEIHWDNVLNIRIEPNNGEPLYLLTMRDHDEQITIDVEIV